MGTHKAAKPAYTKNTALQNKTKFWALQVMFCKALQLEEGRKAISDEYSILRNMDLLERECQSGLCRLGKY